MRAPWLATHPRSGLPGRLECFPGIVGELALEPHRLVASCHTQLQGRESERQLPSDRRVSYPCSVSLPELGEYPLMVPSSSPSPVSAKTTNRVLPLLATNPAPSLCHVASAASRVSTAQTELFCSQGLYLLILEICLLSFIPPFW